MRNNLSKKTIDSPLIEVLQRLDFWLTRDEASRIIVAQPSLKEMKQQTLPDHTRLTPKKLKGPRKPVRGRRYFNQQHMKLARWPKDGMDENALPFILCVVSGQAEFRIADYVLHCSVGDWVFVPAGIPKQDGSDSHFEGDPSGRHCDVLWIFGEMGRDEGLKCWICRSKEQEHFQEKNSNCRIELPFLAQLFNGFCEEVQVTKRPELVAHLLRGVLLLMRSEIENNNGWFGATKQISESETPHDPIEEAQLYVTTHIHRHLTIQAAARQVLVSPSTLTRRFRERTGQSFNEFLNTQRVKLASELLRETDLPISLIGEKAGLKYGQLRILIQNNFNCSPGQLRAMKSKKK